MDKTLLKGLMVLEAVTDMDQPPRTVDELAALVGLTRSNAHRTLQTLIHAGYVARDERGGGYRGTIRLFELGARQLAQLDIRKVASPLMQALADKTGETVHLSVLDGFDVVYIDKIDSPQPIRAYSMVGGRAPAYAVATGKALLAYQPASYVEARADALISHTRATLTSLSALRDDLARTLKQGYAVNRGEWREGVGGVARVVFDSLGQPMAAVGISGPLDRLTPAQVRRFAPEVVSCAVAISRDMGYRDAAPRRRGAKAGLS
ncbi:IclR family transcriptional regulator [Allopusillimonas soli]|uniref:IclR family transcriptional regulator n=1 Tax=Allopusillimonas soli TaxID=659016 RepID=A0A853FHA6_9BURK|nr:IclR family transcriptional regulator [Allopusillimonas soli]NYT37821.1 IclR family transcriptional regulator [Allopusillimonas soli]TEA73729.1 IclR family transcriptional regulator [Allopusillimonas soli]